MKILMIVIMMMIIIIIIIIIVIIIMITIITTTLIITIMIIIMMAIYSQSMEFIKQLDDTLQILTSSTLISQTLSLLSTFI